MANAINPFNAKNVELFIFQIDDYDGLSTILSSSQRSSDNNSLLGALDDAKTDSDISEIFKFSDPNNEFSIEPAEDETENRKHFGVNDLGGQNSDTVVSTVEDVDVTYSQDSQITNPFFKYGLSDDGISPTGFDNYESFSLGSENSTSFGILVRVKKLIKTVYYMRNYVILEPEFKQLGGIDGSQDDTVFETEYSLLGSKSKILMDQYSSSSDETSTNFS